MDFPSLGKSLPWDCAKAIAWIQGKCGQPEHCSKTPPFEASAAQEELGMLKVEVFEATRPLALGVSQESEEAVCAFREKFLIQ